MKALLRLDIIGLGGYAARHHEAVLSLEASGEARLVCTCDPNPAALTRSQSDWHLAARGVSVDTDYPYGTNQSVTISWHHGPREILFLPPHDPVGENLRAQLESLRQKRQRRPTTLADSRPFVHLNALAYLSAGRIQTFAPGTVHAAPTADGFVEIPWLRAAAEDFLETGGWPGDKPDEATSLDGKQLDRVVRRMVENLPSAPLLSPISIR